MLVNVFIIHISLILLINASFMCDLVLNNAPKSCFMHPQGAILAPRGHLRVEIGSKGLFQIMRDGAGMSQGSK